MAHSGTVTFKRGNRKMTTYYIRGSTIWLSYYVEGKRHQKSTKLKNTPKNIKAVEKQIIPAMDIKIATGEIYKKKPKTFEYYGSIFLEHKDKLKSFLNKRAYFQRVIDYFGNKDIDKITRLDIKKYLNDLDMKSTSKSTYKSCIKEIFELAVDDGVINFNPALDIKLPSERKEEIQYYTREEVYKLLNVATGVIKAYLEIAFNTGMRVGEILGLQIGDFKDDGFIHIQRTRTKGIVGNGKTSNAIRKVPYQPFMLNEVKKIQSNNIFIFGNIDDASLLRSQWKRVNLDAGLKRHKLYSTRHTFATLMLQENIVSINELAGLLGHSSPKVTLEHYASVIESKNINLGADFSLFRYNTVTTKNERQHKAL